MKLLALFLLSVSAFAQTVTIPANSMSFTMSLNGTHVNLIGPATAVTLPVKLPANLAISGNLSAVQLTLTGGVSLPTSASGYYLFQLVNGVLLPVAYPPATTAAAKPAVAKKVSPAAKK